MPLTLVLRHRIQVKTPVVVLLLVKDRNKTDATPATPGFVGSVGD